MGVDFIKQLAEGDKKTFPKNGQKVRVHYTGAFDEQITPSEVFDSSRKKGREFVFTLGVGQVIKGWDEGVSKMSVGQRSIIRCSPDYAYGSQGAGGIIKPNQTLFFDVELLGIGA